MYYATGPPPSVRPLNATVGIDSVYLQIKGINKMVPSKKLWVTQKQL